ncbi:MAG TPA: hypothetical protein PLB41_11190, partial [Rubrivivax sp.]|nr:hypothetical protein [Rubrivivax sp.]
MPNKGKHAAAPLAERPMLGGVASFEGSSAMRHRPLIRRRHLLLAAAASGLAPRAFAQAGDWPSHSIR